MSVSTARPRHVQLKTRRIPSAESAVMQPVPVGPSRQALAPGYRLRSFTIDGVLGQGGFGITYLAHDQARDLAVAIKEYLPSELAMRQTDSTVCPITENRREDYAWGLRRFIAEGETLARFDHPNIVFVHEVFVTNGTAYMVMSYEKGVSFADYLPAGGTLSERWLKRMLVAIVDGLHGVHEAGYIHRDIKPANIMIGDFGEVL
ncbi:MAG: serine/threonine protein kinase, partial [Gammaproteobacteria bacterium]|nr:serine/threonine protein kinase [Gammaproteobacteria bacterium]